MEDAMILNKSAVERGLAHATLYKTETLDLHEERGQLQLDTQLRPGAGLAVPHNNSCSLG